MPQLSYKFMSVSIWNFSSKTPIIEVNFKQIKVRVPCQELLEFNGKIECLTKITVQLKTLKESNMELLTLQMILKVLIAQNRMVLLIFC